jgi:cytochrome c oxidase cbb3-type subunit 3
MSAEGKAGKNPLPGDPPVIHEYDGIEECDNHLPNWWLWTLYGAIIFSVGYWFYYHTFHTGLGPTAAYEKEDAEFKAAEMERLKKAGAVTSDLLLALSKDPATLKTGKEVFISTCASCHTATGAGGIGPNLTDAYWLHGGSPESIYKTVKDGWPAKGMSAWGPILGEERVRAAAAYVISIKNTNVPDGKPPQGDKEGS